MADSEAKSATFAGAVVGVAVAALCLLTVCLLMVRCCYQRKTRKSAVALPPMASYDTLKKASELQEKNHNTDATLKLIENELYEVTNRSPTRKTAEITDLSDPSANVYECVK